MKKYTFFLGLNDKDTKTQLVRNEDALFDVREAVAQNLWWWTVTECNWVFKHEDWTIVDENSLRIETLWFNEDQTIYQRFALYLKVKFNQESVLMEVSEVDAQFI